MVHHAVESDNQYASAEEYLSALVQYDHAKRELRQKLQEGFTSETWARDTPKRREELRQLAHGTAR